MRQLGMLTEKLGFTTAPGVLMFELLTKTNSTKAFHCPKPLIPLEKKPSLSSEQLHMVQSVLLHALIPIPWCVLPARNPFA